MFFKKTIMSAAALSTIMVIGAIVAETAIASLVASYFVNQEGLGVKMSYNAAMAAKSGINDAILKVAWNKDLVSGTYSLPVGNASALVTISRSVSSPSDVITISSVGTALDKQSRIQAVVYVNNLTGLVSVNSISEISVN